MNDDQAGLGAGKNDDDGLDVVCMSCGHLDMLHGEAEELCQGGIDCDCVLSTAVIHSVAIGSLQERIAAIEKRLEQPVRDGHPIWTEA